MGLASIDSSVTNQKFCELLGNLNCAKFYLLMSIFFATKGEESKFSW